MKLSEITRVDFDVTHKILIVKSAFLKYLRRMGQNELEYQPFLNPKEAYNSMKKLNWCNILIKFFCFSLYLGY
jgi:hypothetical protein